MIGLVNNEIGAYSIIERISSSIPNSVIYLYKEEIKDIDKIIELLKEKSCKIIIIPKELEYLKDNYKEIDFLVLNNLSKEDSYILESKELEELINNHNLDEIKKYIDNLNIKEETIIINNPNLLFIKSLLEEKYKVIDNLDDLINNIKNIIKDKKIELPEKGDCIVIG